MFASFYFGIALFFQENERERCSSVSTYVEIQNGATFDFVLIFTLVAFWKTSLKIWARSMFVVQYVDRWEISRRFQKCHQFCPYDLFSMTYINFQDGFGLIEGPRW